ncbi:MAG: ATP-binding protein [Acidobacteriia bacterium]|nr:ATP-binding protein [Terriglobia bacterium]
MRHNPWEDNLLERKLESDLKDLPKTLVAFANSVKPGHVATILIGEKNDSSAQGVTNPDEIQKTVRRECEKIYPDILWKSEVYEKDGKYCVRVEIEFSGDTPHFAGSAWVRRGSETVKASDEVFQRLVEVRLDKVRKLAIWEGKEVTVERDEGSVEFERYRYEAGPAYWRGPNPAVLESVNAFWATFQVDGKRRSEPLEKLLLSWDDNRDRLKILVKF